MVRKQTFLTLGHAHAHAYIHTCCLRHLVRRLPHLHWFTVRELAKCFSVLQVTCTSWSRFGTHDHWSCLRRQTQDVGITVNVYVAFKTISWSVKSRAVGRIARHGRDNKCKWIVFMRFHLTNQACLWELVPITYLIDSQISTVGWQMFPFSASFLELYPIYSGCFKKFSNFENHSPPAITIRF